MSDIPTDHEGLDIPEPDPFEALDKWLEGVEAGDVKDLALINRFLWEDEQAILDAPDTISDSDIKLVEMLGPKPSKLEANQRQRNIALQESALMANTQIGEAYRKARNDLDGYVGKGSPIWIHTARKEIGEGITPNAEKTAIHKAISVQLQRRIKTPPSPGQHF